MGHEAKLSIYLGEDDEDDALLFAVALQEIRPPLRLVRFENGLQLLERLRTNDDQGPILVFLDLLMPIMPGLETLAQIRKTPHLQDQPVFILTGSESEQDIQRAYQTGCNGYINKPTSVNQLTQRIKPAIHYWLNFLN
jgi:CheY-like chemotaxis protein